MEPSDQVVIFADDESAGADAAWLWLTEQTWSGWTIKVITALPKPSDHVPTPAEESLHPWEPPHPRPVFAETDAAAVEHLAAVGDPRKVLGQAEGALMVVGPRGRGLWKALHVGSTTEWLIHALPAPVLIARHGRPARRVLVCADSSADSDAAIDALISMPWVGSCDVTVLAVAEPGIDPGAAAAAAVERLGDAPASVTRKVGVPGEFDVFFHVRDIVFDAIKGIDADLVVHGSRGLSDLKSVRVGSIASALARHASCSSLVARAT